MGRRDIRLALKLKSRDQAWVDCETDAVTAHSGLVSPRGSVTLECHLKKSGAFVRFSADDAQARLKTLWKLHSYQRFDLLTDGWSGIANISSYILELNKITDPYRLITYMKDLGTQGYFLTIPSKFISRDGKTVWLALVLSPKYFSLKLAE